MSQKIVIMGDAHGEWAALEKLIEKENPDLLISVGDLGYWPKRGPGIVRAGSVESFFRDNKTKILFCPGNHENWDAIDERKSDEILPNVFYMPRGSTYTLDDGRKILFFGGSDSIDKAWRREGVSWFRQELPSKRHIDRLDPNDKFDIVVSHTCPDELVGNMLKAVGSTWEAGDPTTKYLSYILNTYKPPLWYFGHWHIGKTGFFEITKTKWTALPMSCGNSSWWEVV